MECNHDFHITTDNVLVCVYCGQVRTIYSDGRIFVIKKEGKVTHGEKDI